ncbi:hypothetical protein [Niemeyer virus]|nr:hypothetical protein [Niemeyer virus]
MSIDLEKNHNRIYSMNINGMNRDPDFYLKKAKYFYSKSQENVDSDSTDSDDEKINSTKNVSKNIPKNISKNVPKYIPKNISKNVPKYIPKNISKNVPKYIPKNIPKNISKNVPKNIPKNISKNIPKNISKNVPEYISKNVPKNISKNIPKSVPNKSRNKSRNKYYNSSEDSDYSSDESNTISENYSDEVDTEVIYSDYSDNSDNNVQNNVENEDDYDYEYVKMEPVDLAQLIEEHTDLRSKIKPKYTRFYDPVTRHYYSIDKLFEHEDVLLNKRPTTGVWYPEIQNQNNIMKDPKTGQLFRVKKIYNPKGKYHYEINSVKRQTKRKPGTTYYTVTYEDLDPLD